MFLADAVKFGLKSCRVCLFSIECNLTRTRVVLGVAHIKFDGEMLLLSLELGEFLTDDNSTSTCRVQPARYQHAEHMPEQQAFGSASDPNHVGDSKVVPLRRTAPARRRPRPQVSLDSGRVATNQTGNKADGAFVV
jgi:hypothetical protein